MKDEAFVSKTDNTKIFVRIWRPQGPARALLVIAHGFKAHGGLYGWAAEQLAKRGISVYALDHRGHGNSGGERYEVGNMSEFVADIDQLVELAKKREPGLPLFLLGHSAEVDKLVVVDAFDWGRSETFRPSRRYCSPSKATDTSERIPERD